MSEREVPLLPTVSRDMNNLIGLWVASDDEFRDFLADPQGYFKESLYKPTDDEKSCLVSASLYLQSTKEGEEKEKKEELSILLTDALDCLWQSLPVRPSETAETIVQGLLDELRRKGEL